MKAIFEPFIIILKDKYIKYPDEIIKNIVRIYETENTNDAKPVITKAHTMRYPIVSPTKNLTPSLNEKAAPTPAKARTAGPGSSYHNKNCQGKCNHLKFKPVF